MFGQINVNFPINCVDCLTDFKGSVANVAGLSALTDVQEGQWTFVRDVDSFYYYDGSSWVLFDPGGGSGTGVDYVLQSTAPTDTTKFWLNNSTGSNGIWTFNQRIQGQWRTVMYYDPIGDHLSPMKPLYVLGTGQSNMTYRGTGGDLDPDSRVTEWNGSSWEIADYSVAGTNNLTLQFAKNIAKNQNRSVRYNVIATNSRPIEDWYPDSIKNDQIVSFIQAANIDSLDVILWRQGERNADLGDTKSQYAAKFDSIVGNWSDSTWFGKSGIVIAGGLNESYEGDGPYDFFNDLNSPSDGRYNVIGSSSLGLSRSGGIHIDGASIDTAGYRMYEAYVRGGKQYTVNSNTGITDRISVYEDENTLTPSTHSSLINSTNTLNFWGTAINNGTGGAIRFGETSANPGLGAFIKYDNLLDNLLIGGNNIATFDAANDVSSLYLSRSASIGINGTGDVNYGLAINALKPNFIALKGSDGSTRQSIDSLARIRYQLEIYGGNTSPQWPVLLLSSTSNTNFESGRIRFTKNGTWLGSFIHNDGSSNYLRIGTHNANDTNAANDINVINIPRGGTGVGILTTPTAKLHLAAGTATASTAPLKLSSGTNLTVPESGAVEWDGSRLYITQTSGPTRKTIAYSDDTGLTDDQTAAEVSYDNSTSGLTATNVKTAIDETVGLIPDNISDLTISADVDVNNNKLTNVTPGTTDGDAATWEQVDTISTDIRYKGFTSISTDPSATLSPRPKEVYYFNTTSAGWTQEFSDANLKPGNSFLVYFLSTDTNTLTLDSTNGGFIRPNSNGDTLPDATEDVTTLGQIEFVWTGSDFLMVE